MKQKLTLNIIIGVLMIISNPLYAQYARDKRENPQTETISSDSLIVRQLRQKGITFSHNNSVRLLKSGKEKFDDLFLAIKDAKESIHMEYFNFRNDSIANHLFDILAEKCRQGVEVRLLFDAFGNTSNNRPLKRKHLDKIRQLGIQIYAFDDIRFPWINHVFSRDHRKIVVIDGEIAYTGGMNIADYYIDGTKVVGEWHDMHCRIEGEEVNTLQRIFLEAWYKVTNEIITDSKYFRGSKKNKNAFADLAPDQCESSGNKMIGIINREPRISNDIIRYFYINAINSAQDSIKIINPYFTLSPKLKKAIKRASKRGVKVEIMLSMNNDILLTPDCGFYNAHKLMKNGCNVWIFKPGFHHTKIITVDDKFCTIGSANLNARSLRWDYEANAVIVDQCTTQQLSSMFNTDKANSFQLTKEVWNKWRTPWQKFRGWFANILSPFL